MYSDFHKITTNLVNIWHVSFWTFSFLLHLYIWLIPIKGPVFLICQFYDFLYSSSLILIFFLLLFFPVVLKCFFNSNSFTWSFIYFAPSLLIRKALTALKLPLLPTALALPHLFSLYNVFIFIFLAFHNHSFTLLFDPRARCFISFHSFFLVYISF